MRALRKARAEVVEVIEVDGDRERPPAAGVPDPPGAPSRIVRRRGDPLHLEDCSMTGRRRAALKMRLGRTR
ncbi:hypothetical protein GCM10010336_68460 [Streptomyces goshikiensis]|nr:hypothetical protein GCM10010336_68460 [Streptomyces goshikiensis]